MARAPTPNQAGSWKLSRTLGGGDGGAVGPNVVVDHIRICVV